METKTAEKILEMMIALLLSYLDELFSDQDDENEQFLYGERIAFTECLEWIQQWEKAREYQLNFDIEQRYPLS